MSFNFSAIILIINIVLALALVFLERRNPTVTWAWILILMFIPGLGFILYLFLGQNYRRKKRFTAKGQEDLIKAIKQKDQMLHQHHLNFLEPEIQDIKDLILLFYRNSDRYFPEIIRLPF